MNRVSGFVLNPFLEGIILIGVGILCEICAKIYTIPDLADTGKLIIGSGIGYITKTTVEATAR